MQFTNEEDLKQTKNPSIGYYIHKYNKYFLLQILLEN